MKEKELHERFRDFLQGTNNSASEDKELKKMLHTLDRLSRSSFAPSRDQMWKRIYEEITISRKRSIRRWWLAAAASLPFIIGGALLYFSQIRNIETSTQYTAISRDQVQLFLPGNRTIYVQQVEKDSLLHEKEAGIWIDTSNLMVYTPEKTQSTELTYNTINIPRCCEYHMILADGTEVWLNSESELRFPMSFVGNERRVFLKGEAYFQVAEDKTKPFRVEAQGLEVEALGTAFDVNVYGDAEKMSATLLSGSVKVTDLETDQTCVLKPGEQAVLRNWELSINSVDAQDVISWKDGRFVFSNVTLQEIAKQLERWYDVHIQFQDQTLRYYRFTGVIKRYNELEQLIDMLEETTDVRFLIEGRKLSVYQAKQKH